MRAQAKGSKVLVDLCLDQRMFEPSSGKAIRVVTASSLLQHLTNQNGPAALPDISLVICENLEQLDAPYELAISLLRHAVQALPTRFVGLSSSLNDPRDLAGWLHADPLAVHSFQPIDREQSLAMSTETFTLPYSAALFKAMAKPAHTAIQTAPTGESAILFVPSRAQCRSVALDLITQTALQMETARGYLPEGVSDDHIYNHSLRLQDRSLFDFISRGVGFFHESIAKSDRTLMLELFADGVLKVLIVPHESCWSLPVRAAVVVVMGTQYMATEGADGHRQIRDYNLPELVRMQGRAVRHHRAGRFFLFCHTEARDTFLRFLNDGLPLESQLLETQHLRHWHSANKKTGKLTTTQQIVDALSFTFFAKRAMSNPSYYDLGSESLAVKLSRIADGLVEESIAPSLPVSSTSAPGPPP